MTPFHLTVLGPPELRAPNGDPIRFRTRKHLALLIYLAVERPIAHRRDKLAALLWPNSEMEEARHSLATALSFLRARLGSGAFDAGRESIRLLPGRVQTDLEGLDSRSLEEDHEELLPGRFLEEFEVPGANDFQQWCDAHRARCTPRLQAILIRKIGDARQQGDARSMDVLANQLRQLDRLSEDGIRAAVEARAMTGDRIGALQMFEAWRITLATELGAAPSRSLERLGSRLRCDASDVSSALRDEERPVLSATSRAHFGRHADFAVARRQWERACRRLPSHIHILGERGIGKSSFADQLSVMASLDGGLSSYIRCHEAEHGVEFGALAAVVEKLSHHPGALATAPHLFSVLVTYFPRLQERFSQPLISAAHVAPGDHLLLVEAVRALVGAVSAEHPLLIVLDDAHWMDQPSMGALHSLMRSITEHAVMFAFVSRREATAAKMLEGSTLPTMQSIVLGPLTSAESEEMALSILGEKGDSDLQAVRLLVQCSAGLPLAIHELATNWQTVGSPSLTASLVSLSDRTDRENVGAYSRQVSTLLAGLSKAELRTAQFASLLTRRLDATSLYSLIGLTHSDVMGAFAGLQRAGILIESGSELSFRNAIVRAQCYSTLATSIRKQLHRDIATALASDRNLSSPDDLAIATHLLKAGDTSGAIPFLRGGSTGSIRLGLPGQAAQALTTGLATAPPDTSRDIVLTLAEAKQEMGRWEESQSLIADCLAEHGQQVDSRLRLIRTLNERFLGILVGARLEEETNGLLAIAADSHESLDLRVRSISAATALISSSRDKRHIQRLGEIATGLRDRELDDYQSIHLLHGLAWFRAQSVGPIAALPLLLDGIAKIDKTGTGDSIATRLLLGAGVTLCQLGRYEEAAPHLRRAYTIATRLGNAALVANAASGVALVEGRLGNHEEQISFAREAIRASNQAEWGICILSAAYDQGLGLAIAGRAIEAESAMAAFDSRFDQRRPVWVQQAWKLCKADVLALAGNERKALSAGKVGTSGELKNLHHDCFAGQYARWVAFAGIRTGTAAGALARLERQVESLDRHDAKDQAEILAAVAILERAVGKESAGKWAQARSKLELLPQPTQTMIRRLGLNQPAESATWGVRGTP